MNIINKKVSDVIPYENNPRRNEDAVEYVANSIKQFGFKVPIIIDKEGVIVAGHTRYLAAQMIGMSEVPCVVADDLTDEEIKAFRIADNKTAERSYWDEAKLKLELSDLLDDFDMTDFGFGDFELTILTGDVEPEPYDNDMIREYGDHEKEFLKKSKVIITYTEDRAEDVKELLGIEALTKVVYDITEVGGER